MLSVSFTWYGSAEFQAKEMKGNHENKEKFANFGEMSSCYLEFQEGQPKKCPSPQSYLLRADDKNHCPDGVCLCV